MRLRSKRAVVTGASSPIGLASVQTFAAEGARVLAVDRVSPIPNDRPDRQLHEMGGIRHLVADPSEDDGIRRIVEVSNEGPGAVDILFHAVGQMDTPEHADYSVDAWVPIFRTNLFAPAALTWSLFSALSRSRGASVIFLGSIDGSHGNPSLPAYSASKGGLEVLTHVLADAWGPGGVRVNCIATGLIHHQAPDSRADLGRASRFAELERITPLRRPPDAQEIAQAALFLATDEASYITGTVLTVDGGRLAATPGTSRSETLPPS